MIYSVFSIYSVSLYGQYLNRRLIRAQINGQSLSAGAGLRISEWLRIPSSWSDKCHKHLFKSLVAREKSKFEQRSLRHDIELVAVIDVIQSFT